MKINGFVAAILHVVCSMSSLAVLHEPAPSPLPTPPGDQTRKGSLCVSGVYPHLAAFSTNGEVGIGALAPWAGKLWFITYPPHFTRGSTDKLYEIDPDLTEHLRPESVGGTHAGRMIHRESNQLIIGPYFIDDKGNVRAADLHKLVGRMTAVMRHLTDPANKVYFFDMEGAFYEVDVHTLAVTKLFDKPVPGWHGKGGYTAQGRVVIANNGEEAVGSNWRNKLQVNDLPPNPENAGILAEWDGKTWQIVERRQFTDITGPGGIYGSPDDKAPLWAIGWDKRSLMLKLLDGGTWYTFRLPKATHTYDPKHGWYTEWPRIRDIGGGKWMMTMHGMFWDFPATFSAANTAGIRPIASYLRIVPDFCSWQGKLVLACDETTIMANPMAGLSQSNLWFGQPSDLPTYGPRSGYGGVWMQDAVTAGKPSDPFLLAGFDKRVLHLAHNADAAVTFTLEVDSAGDGKWTPYQKITVPAKGYQFHVIPKDLAGWWIRVTADKDCKATAYFHYSSVRDASQDNSAMFASLPKVGDSSAISGGIIRPGNHNRNLQFLARTAEGGKAGEATYMEVDQTMTFSKPPDDYSEEVAKIASVKVDFQVDDASVIMIDRSYLEPAKSAKTKPAAAGKRYRLPKTDAAYNAPLALGWPRCVRECITERFLVNVHGSFYEMPRDAGLPLIKPVCTHGRQIMDFCTWRGVIALSGNLASAKADGHYFPAADGRCGLWFGIIDDLWKLGKPVGKGGPWRNTAVKTGEASDPYLMTGYDSKRIEMSHDAAGDVEFTVEVDIDHHEFVTYKTFTVPAGKTETYVFPDGFSAHWVRLRAGKDCKATAILTYE